MPRTQQWPDYLETSSAEQRVVLDCSGELQTAHSITIEATLSFLGVGVPITEPSLGSLISNGFDFILSGAYWITFFPGVMLLATVAAINIFGDQLRTIINPRLSR